MTIQDKIREITGSEELLENEKLDRLRALIPDEALKIDNMSAATLAQLRQLQDALAISQAIQRLKASSFWERNKGDQLGLTGCEPIRFKTDSKAFGVFNG